MHKKNKLGIYVYPYNTEIINYIHWDVNSISYNFQSKFRVINNNYYGIHLFKEY